MPVLPTATPPPPPPPPPQETTDPINSARKPLRSHEFVIFCSIGARETDDARTRSLLVW
jgi:hypothetical protein